MYWKIEKSCKNYALTLWLCRQQTNTPVDQPLGIIMSPCSLGVEMFLFHANGPINS